MRGCPAVNSPVFLIAVWPSRRGLLWGGEVQVMLGTLWSCSHTRTAIHIAELHQ